MDLTPTEQDVLMSLSHEHGQGCNIAANLADETGRSPRAVGRALSSLHDRGLIASKGRGVYRLTNRGDALVDAAAD